MFFFSFFMKKKDFGCAASVAKDEFSEDDGLTDLCGSPGYIAPEVIAASILFFPSLLC